MTGCIVVESVQKHQLYNELVQKLLHNRAFRSLAIVFALLIGGLVIVVGTLTYSLKHLSFREVTPTQMAAAMRQDEFWSSYRFNTLVFRGKVQTVSSKNGQSVVTLATSDSYGVVCELPAKTTLKVGRTYTFAAESYQAERQPVGVLLHNCLIP